MKLIELTNEEVHLLINILENEQYELEHEDEIDDRVSETIAVIVDITEKLLK